MQQFWWLYKNSLLAEASIVAFAGAATPQQWQHQRHSPACP